MITQLVSVKLKHFLSFTRVYISVFVIDFGLISKLARYVCACDHASSLQQFFYRIILFYLIFLCFFLLPNSKVYIYIYIYIFHDVDDDEGVR